MSIRIQLSASALVLATALSAFALTVADDEAKGPAQGDAAKSPLAKMDWLAGSWSGEMWGGVFNAHYSTPAGGKILSHSRLMNGEKEAFYEFELFELRDDVVYLQPFPGGEKAGGFDLQSLDVKARKAVFENPDKDFPTRIVYQRASDDVLEITLSDPHGGSEKVETFVLKR